MADSRTDAELIAASRADGREFAQIFDRHFVAVHGYLARRAGHGLADELAGEVFRVAFEQRGRYDLAFADARPWLFGIATRLYWRAARQAERAGRAHQRAATSLQLVDTSTGGADQVDDRVSAQATSARLQRAVESLAERDRDALLLVAWEGMTYAEVARALDVPVGTVRSRIFRARAQLRELLQPGGQYPCDQADRR